MKGLSRPENFVASGDKTMIIVSAFIAGACAFGIPSLAAATPLNDILMNGVTFPVGVLMCAIPFLMYFGVHINQQHKFDDLVRERNIRRAAAIVKKLLFRCRFRGDESGTQWELVNANHFDWTDAKLLLERTFDNETVTEKINLGRVPMGSTITVEADLVDISLARWRVMVISREGQLVDFPNRWLESELRQ